MTGLPVCGVVRVVVLVRPRERSVTELTLQPTTVMAAVCLLFGLTVGARLAVTLAVTQVVILSAAL